MNNKSRQEKCDIIDRILYNQLVTLEQLDTYCREEAINQTCYRKDIGFRV